MVAVDDSPHSERAVRFVTRMRWPAGSRMVVVHVRPDGTDPPRPSAARAEGHSGENRKPRPDAVITSAQSALRDAGISTDGRTARGDPRDQLVTLAACERMDLIVVGSRAHRGLARFLLGSVSSHVVTHAPCSVLVVKPGAGDPFESPEPEAGKKRSAPGGSKGGRR